MHHTASTITSSGPVLFHLCTRLLHPQVIVKQDCSISWVKFSVHFSKIIRIFFKKHLPQYHITPKKTISQKDVFISNSFKIWEHNQYIWQVPWGRYNTKMEFKLFTMCLLYNGKRNGNYHIKATSGASLRSCGRVLTSQAHGDPWSLLWTSFSVS